MSVPMEAAETTHCVFLRMNGSKYKKFRIWRLTDFTCSNHLTDPNLLNQQVFQITAFWTNFLLTSFPLMQKFGFELNL